MSVECEDVRSPESLVEALFQVWTAPPPDVADAVEAFRAIYTDPVEVNGATVSVAQLARLAHQAQDTYDQTRRELVDVFSAGDKVAVALRMTARHVGPLTTAAGVLPATARTVSLRIIDLLTLTDGRISAVTMVADELGALSAIGAVQLIYPH